MKQKILLLNVARTRESNEKKYCKIEFSFWQPDSKTDSENVKGYSVVSMFFDRETFDKIPLDWCGKAVDCYLKDVPDKFNPLNKKTKITALEYDGRSIDLL